MVYGMAGIGKTTLAVKLLEKLHDNHNLFWYRFHEWDTLRNLLNSFSKFLENFQLRKLKKYLESNLNIDLNDVGDILEDELNESNALFFFDDFHKINEQLIGFYTLLREILERISGVKSIIFSRSFIGFYDRRDVLVKNIIYELELEGLNEEDSKELLEHRNITFDNFKRLYDLTKGHPLSLELLDPDVDIHKQKNIKLYLEEEVLARLSLREKSLLKIASVFRYPVPADGFFIYEKAQISRETLSLLARRSLIKESSEGFEIHDLIRDFFYSYLTQNERISYHRRVGQFYLDRLKMLNDLLKKKISTEFRPKTLFKSSKSLTNVNNIGVETLLEQRSRGILETQYHFLMAKDHNRAAELAIILGKELLNLPYVEELLDNLEKIEIKNLNDEYYMDLKILKGLYQ
jgi:ATP/maltotriose-dependent transcriptional regulator MalT